MAAIRFCELTEEHLAEVAEIYNYFVVNTTISFHTEPVSLEEMRSIVISANPRYESYVIERDRAIVGYVLIGRHKIRQAYDDTGEVTIYLRPECVGQGIGGAALRFIEEVARRNRFHVLVATICAENESSKILFERHDYEQCAHFKEVGYKFGRWLDIVSYQKIMR